MPKPIVFSTATPNDQGGVIPNEVIDFSRFNKNPVVLNEHNWGEDPIGMWTNIKLVSGKWTGTPIFHALTDTSKRKKDLYDGGWIRAASIGGEAIWEENAAGQYKLNTDGNRMCKKFYLYEISIVTLPSNEDAVQEEAVELHAKIYEHSEIENITKTITTLSSKYNSNTMITKKEFDKLSAEDKVTKIEEMKAIIADAEAEKTEKDQAKTTLAAISQEPGLPKWFKEIISLGGVIKFGSEKEANGAPAPKDTPASTQQKEKDVAGEQPKPIGLKAKTAEKAKTEMEIAKETADKAVDKVKECKEAAEKEGASDEDMAAYKKAKEDADDAMKACEAAESAYNKAKEDAEDDEEEENDEEKEKATKEKKAAKVKTTNSAKPIMKTAAQIKEELKLASAPSRKAKVIGFAGKTFSELRSSKDANDQKLMARVLTNEGGGKDIAEYEVILNSIIGDSKYAAIVEKTRVMANVTEAQLGSLRYSPEARAGISLQNLAADFNRGEISMLGRDNVLRNVTTLSSTDNALASPALNTIEWLSLVIFKLFPSTAWKNEVSIFPATITGVNTGIIWANIAADPAIYKGNQPVNPADYTYNDVAVALSLTPYWMQPMRWTPLTMHQLRYDQMGTGWAQAFAKLNAVIDDNLIYTIASTVPASSIVFTSGLSGYQTTPQQFTIASATDPNAFYYNPAFTGTLKSPVLNDIAVVEQIYMKQNFELESERATIVCDPTMDTLFSKDPETKSLLTRWVNSDGGSFLKYKDTLLPKRSRVAIYDPATGQVKDPNGAIPATAISASLGFIPSQVGMGLGMLDVFMIQDPTNYGYKMSTDIRMGIAPLRADFSGTSLLTFGAGASVPSNG